MRKKEPPIIYNEPIVFFLDKKTLRQLAKISRTPYVGYSDIDKVNQFKKNLHEKASKPSNGDIV